jgi:hypothetical protein
LIHHEGRDIGTDRHTDPVKRQETKPINSDIPRDTKIQNKKRMWSNESMPMDYKKITNRS